MEALPSVQQSETRMGSWLERPGLSANQGWSGTWRREVGGRWGCWLEEDDSKGGEAEKDSCGASDPTDVGKVFSLLVNRTCSSPVLYHR